jgi:hypothetical protein
MIVCHMILGCPWQFDKGALHDGRSNTYSFSCNHNTFLLRPMTPSQVIADNAKAIARTQDKPHNGEMRGYLENHLHVHESNKPNWKMKCVLLATQSEMREVQQNPSLMQYVLICK